MNLLFQQQQQQERRENKEAFMAARYNYFG